MDLSGFSQKLQRLVKEYEQIKREHEKLKADFAISQAERREFSEHIATLETQVVALQATGKTLGEQDKEEMGKRIDKYVKEIDKAITLLNG